MPKKLKAAFFASKTHCFCQKSKGDTSVEKLQNNRIVSKTKIQTTTLWSTLFICKLSIFLVQCETRTDVLLPLRPQNIRVNLYVKWQLDVTSCNDSLPVSVLPAMRASTDMQKDSGMDTIKNIKTDVDWLILLTTLLIKSQIFSTSQKLT